MEKPLAASNSAMSMSRDRTIEDLVFAHLAVHLNHDLRKLLSEGFSILPFQGFAPDSSSLFLFNLLHVGRRGQHGQPFRQKVVAGIARADVHNIAAPAQIVDSFAKDDFHRTIHSKRQL